jgi:predicted O-methyltransferase YrrM
MHHSTFVGYIASIYKPNIYVELGLYQGETILKVQPHVNTAYGIDLKSNNHLEQLKSFSNLNIRFQSTDDFFAEYMGSIDMAFIDADHCYESAKKDFLNVFSRLSPGGIILVHDTDPINDSYIHPGYCGDSYQMVTWLESHPDVNIITLPIQEAGISIITKKNQTRTQLRQK